MYPSRFSPEQVSLTAAVLHRVHVAGTVEVSTLPQACSSWIALCDLNMTWYGSGWERATGNLHPYHPHFCLIKFAKGVSLTVIKPEGCSCLLIPSIYGLQPLVPSSYNQKNDRFTAETTASYFDRSYEICYQELAQRHSAPTKAPKQGSTNPGCTGWFQGYCSNTF